MNAIEEENSNGGWSTVGWIYQVGIPATGGGTTTVRYVQGYLGDTQGLTFSLNLGLVSVGESGAEYTPLSHYSGSLPASAGPLSVQKCETDGSVLA